MLYKMHCDYLLAHNQHGALFWPAPLSFLPQDLAQITIGPDFVQVYKGVSPPIGTGLNRPCLFIKKTLANKVALHKCSDNDGCSVLKVGKGLFIAKLDHFTRYTFQFNQQDQEWESSRVSDGRENMFKVQQKSKINLGGEGALPSPFGELNEFEDESIGQTFGLSTIHKVANFVINQQAEDGSENALQINFQKSYQIPFPPISTDKKIKKHQHLIAEKIQVQPSPRKQRAVLGCNLKGLSQIRVGKMIFDEDSKLDTDQAQTIFQGQLKVDQQMQDSPVFFKLFNAALFGTEQFTYDLQNIRFEDDITVKTLHCPVLLNQYSRGQVIVKLLRLLIERAFEGGDAIYGVHRQYNCLERVMLTGADSSHCRQSWIYLEDGQDSKFAHKFHVQRVLSEQQHWIIQLHSLLTYQQVDYKDAIRIFLQKNTGKIKETEWLAVLLLAYSSPQQVQLLYGLLGRVSRMPVIQLILIYRTILQKGMGKGHRAKVLILEELTSRLPRMAGLFLARSGVSNKDQWISFIKTEEFSPLRLGVQLNESRQAGIESIADLIKFKSPADLNNIQFQIVIHQPEGL